MPLKFSFGAPLPPSLLYGRDTLIANIVRRLLTINEGVRNDIALIGPRRVGKSSILRSLESRLSDKKILPIYIDCEGLDLISFLKAYGNTIIEADLKRRGMVGKFGEQIKRGFTEVLAVLSEALGKVRSVEASSPLVKFLELRIELERTAQKLTDEDIYALFESTISLPERLGVKCVAMFDEFQETKNYSLLRGDFHSNFRNLTQRQKNVGYVYTGSAVGMIQEIFGAPENPLAGNVEMLYVEPFSEETAKAFLKERLAEAGILISDGSAKYLYEITGGFPAYLNWAGLRICDVAKEGRVDDETVKEVHEAMLSVKSPIYPMIDRQLVRLGKKTKNLLKIIALGYTNPVDIGRESNARNVYVYLDRLQKYGILQKTEDGKYQIIDPVIAAYLRER